MWPFRPDKLTEILSKDDLRVLLQLGDSLGSAVTLVERDAENELRRLDPDRSDRDRAPDAFCDFFRHGRVAGRPAFNGANEACEQCEQKFARRLMSPAPGSELAVRPTGVSALRCHMGLTDYVAPIAVGGRVVAGLIAGRRIEAEDDRLRIRKTVGKLGKLTRAEAEAENAGDRLIEPADEKVRDRLIQEIASIPLRSEALEQGLARLAKLLSRLASRQFDSVRRGLEDVVIERIDARHGEVPAQFAGLRRDTSNVLHAIREELQFKFLAFFAALPKELDNPETRPSLVAESGLDLASGRRMLEIDTSKLPAVSLGREAEVTRGLAAVSTLAKALEETKEAEPDLKNRLTKSLFVAPVEFGPYLRAVLCFGPPESDVTPEAVDFLFLSRVARAVTRHYYAIAAELERRWLSERLETEGSARREAEASARELERTEGFTYFDARKALNQCLERAVLRARDRGVELDTRDCLERITLRADRKEITDVFRRIVDEGIERTYIDPESRKGSPVRLFLKRNRTRILFGVELIGDPLTPRDRRVLFSKDEKADIRAEKASDGTAVEGRSLAEELAILRRHEGHLRVESERLHRLEKDPTRWLGRTTFFVDLPVPGRPEHHRAESAQGARRVPPKSKGPSRVPAEAPSVPAGAAGDEAPAPADSEEAPAPSDRERSEASL